MPLLSCLLCGIESPDVRVRLVRWRDPGKGPEYESIPACSRVPECRARVEREEPWPIVEPEREQKP